MAEETADKSKSGIAIKAAAAVFVTVLAPVLVALGMKMVDKVDALIPTSKPAEKSAAATTDAKPAAAVPTTATPTGTAPSSTAAVTAAAVNREQATDGLFRETQLNADWSFYQTEPGPLDLQRFQFKPDGTIAVSTAGPKGALLRPTEYENYEMSFDWRFAPGTKSGANSWPGGVLIRCGLENWPENRLSSVFAVKQIGKFYMGKNATLETTELNEGAVAKPGEWHSMNIVCQGGDVTVSFDQAVIARGTNCSRKKGRIGFAIDNRDLEFREVKVVRLAKADLVPAETKPPTDADTKKKSKKTRSGRN